MLRMRCGLSRPTQKSQAFVEWYRHVVRGRVGIAAWGKAGMQLARVRWAGPKENPRAREQQSVATMEIFCHHASGSRVVQARESYQHR